MTVTTDIDRLRVVGGQLLTPQRPAAPHRRDGGRRGGVRGGQLRHASMLTPVESFAKGVCAHRAVGPPGGFDEPLC